MIQEQIILSGAEKSLAELTTAVNNGDYDYILLERQFLYYTKDAGLVIVNVDKTITINPTVQLGEGLKKASNGIILDPATDNMIDDKTFDNYALTPKHLNYAVKSALTATNGVAFTADDLTKVKSLFQLHKVATSGSYNDLLDKPVTATSTVEGYTKLYAELGDNTDGTLTQAAIKSELSKKAGSGDAYTKSQSDTKYVAKVEGMDLSSNDYTSAEKTKLESIEEGANKYVLPSDVVKDAKYVHTDTNFTAADKAEVDKVASKADAAALADYVKFTDYAKDTAGGVIKIGVRDNGLMIDSNGILYTVAAENSSIANRVNQYKLITPLNLNTAVKAALSDAKRISDMTDEEKANAREVIGAISLSDISGKQDALTFDDTPIADSENPVKSSGIYAALNTKLTADDLASYVKNTDYATLSKAGIIKIGEGFKIVNDNTLYPLMATEADIDARITEYEPIVPANLEYAVRSVLPKVNTSIGDSIVKNCVYDLGEQSSLSVTLPETGSVGEWLQIDFMSGATATTLAITSTAGILGYDLIPEINTIYSLYLDWGMIGKSDTGSTYGWRFSYSEYPINA